MKTLFKVCVIQFALEGTTFKTKLSQAHLKNLKDSLSSEIYSAMHRQVRQGKDVWKTKRLKAMFCLFSLSQSRRTATNVMPQTLKEQALSRQICKLLDGHQTIKAKIAFKC